MLIFGHVLRVVHSKRALTWLRLLFLLQIEGGAISLPCSSWVSLCATCEPVQQSQLQHCVEALFIHITSISLLYCHVTSLCRCVGSAVNLMDLRSFS
jgi:hypothetical protein